MDRETVLQALRQAGVEVDTGPLPAERGEKLTKADLYALGLSGGTGSTARRKALLERLRLPEHLTSNALLDVLNALYTPQELRLHILNTDGGNDTDKQHT